MLEALSDATAALALAGPYRPLAERALADEPLVARRGARRARARPTTRCGRSPVGGVTRCARGTSGGA